jgi:UDP-N-acetylmuramoyl-tripeptide--D-alanyl-D-alanine ligase
VGEAAQRSGIEMLGTAGALCAHSAQAYGRGRHFDSVESLLGALRDAPSAASVLVKGSRFMKMERVVEDMQQQAAAASQPFSSVPKEKAC